MFWGAPRSSVLHAGGQGFDSPHLHQLLLPPACQFLDASLFALIRLPGVGPATSLRPRMRGHAGDTFRVRFAELNTTTSFKTFETTGIVSSSGFAVVVDAIGDSVYASNGIDGSSTDVTDIFTADYVNNEIDLDTNMDFTHPKAFAFVSFEQTTSQGMFQIWRIVNAIDAGNYENDVDVLGILFDETAGFVKQEDSDTSRWFRSDGNRPFKDPTTGDNGISMNWKNPVFTISTGSVLTSLEKSQLETSATESTDANTKLGTPAADVSADIATRMATTHIDATAGKVDGVALVDQTTVNDDMVAEAPTAAANADKILGRNLGAGSDGGRTVQDALRSSRNKVTVDAGAGTIDVFEEDDSTVAWSGTIATGARDPINDIDPA